MHRMHINKRYAQMHKWTQSSFNERGNKFKKVGGCGWGGCTQKGEVGFSVDPGGRGVVTEGRGPAGP